MDIIPNSKENQFYKVLIEFLKTNGLNPEQLKTQRLSDGTFNVWYGSICYVGKIKLAGRKYYMQYFLDINTVKELKNTTVEECIGNIPQWIKYIKDCQKH